MTNTNFGKSYPGNFRASWMYERKPWVRPAEEADTSDVVLAELRETTAQLEVLGREPTDEIPVLQEQLRQREAQIKELQAKVQGLVVDLDAPAPALDGEADRRDKARKAKKEWEARKRAKRYIREMEIGEIGWSVPWSLDRPGHPGLDPDFSTHPDPCGTRNMQVERVHNGFKILKAAQTVEGRVVQLAVCGCSDCNPAPVTNELDVQLLGALAKEDLRRYEGTAHADPIAHKQRMEHARRAVVRAAQAAEERRILAAGARKPPAWDPLGMAEFAWFLGEPGPKPPPPSTRSERARDLLVAGVTGLINAGVALLAWPARVAYRLFLNRIFAWVLTMLGIAYGVVDLAFGHFLLGPITVIGWSVYFIAVMSHKSNTRRPNHRLGTVRRDPRCTVRRSKTFADHERTCKSCKPVPLGVQRQDADVEHDVRMEGASEFGPRVWCCKKCGVAWTLHRHAQLCCSSDVIDMEGY